MSKLKRCPICNAEVKLMFLNCETFEDSVWDESIGNVPTWFKCYGCDSEFFHDEPIDTPEKQVEWWNTRKPMDRIVERLEIKLSDTVYEKATQESNESHLNGLSIGYCEAIGIVKEEGDLNE